jgi:thioredoxin reductase (NADPH)
MTIAGNVLPLSSSRAEQLFPTLTLTQIQRIASRGHLRRVQEGEVLGEQGDTAGRFFVVVSGELEVVRPASGGNLLIWVYLPGQFTGEIAMLSGRRALFRLYVTKPGEVIEVDRQSMLTLVQTDTELGEIMLRALIRRRVELVAAGVGDVVLNQPAGRFRRGRRA